MNSQSSRRNILGTKEITKATKNTTKNTTKHYKKGLQKKIPCGIRTDSEHSVWNPYRVRAFRAEYQGGCKVLWKFILNVKQPQRSETESASDAVNTTLDDRIREWPNLWVAFRCLCGWDGPRPASLGPSCCIYFGDTEIVTCCLPGTVQAACDVEAFGRCLSSRKTLPRLYVWGGLTYSWSWFSTVATCRSAVRIVWNCWWSLDSQHTPGRFCLW